LRLYTSKIRGFNVNLLFSLTGKVNGAVPRCLPTTVCASVKRLLVQTGRSLYDETMTTTIFKILAWSALLAVAAATLSPIEVRPRLAVPVDLERLAAFALVGLLFALAYPRRIWIAVAIVAIGVFGLEWLQHIRPDRHGRAEDALVKAAGALAGLGTGWVMIQFKLWRRRAG
jgi:VanZ family protein